MPSHADEVPDSAITKRLASRPAEPARLLGCDPNHRIGTSGSVFFVLWKGDVECRIAERVQVSLRAFAQSLEGRRAALLTVVEHGAPLPSSDARTALANILRYNADEVLASAVVMEGDGFRASAVRSVATGLALVARQPFPHRVFPRTLDATEWLAQRLSGEPGSATAVEISRAMDEIRADVSARVRLRDVG